MKTIRSINKLLKEYDIYFQLPFNEIARIKKVEFDSENKRFWNWVKDIWAFYLIYDSDWVENISEWVLYWENKNEWIEKLYNNFEFIKNLWLHIISK